jgi:hypothetical protein
VVFRRAPGAIRLLEVQLRLWHWICPKEGERPVRVDMQHFEWFSDERVLESDCLRMQSKVGGKLHPRLNTGTSPIVNKYREGKLKSTLKRE